MKNKPHRALVFIAKALEVNRFILSGTFDNLLDKYKLKFVLPHVHGNQGIPEYQLKTLGINYDIIPINKKRIE